MQVTEHQCSAALFRANLHGPLLGAALQSRPTVDIVHVQLHPSILYASHTVITAVASKAVFSLPQREVGLNRVPGFGVVLVC